MIKFQNFIRTFQKCNFAKKYVKKEFTINLDSFKSNLFTEISDLKNLSNRSLAIIYQKDQLDGCLKSLSEPEYNEFKVLSIF